MLFELLQKGHKVLDAKENLHLAINAMTRDEHHAALNYIKEVLALEPKNADALYLLGAEHAELGLYDRAIEEIEQALQIDANIEMARFQLGLLYLKVNQLDGAAAAFTYLIDRSNVDSLAAYATGLLALCNNDVLRAREKIALGLSITNDNPALKKDMQKLLTNLLDDESTKIQEASIDDSVAASIYLGAYKTKN